MSEVRACCHACAGWMPAVELLDHLRTAHGVVVSIEAWPDGEPVVVDHTLTPDDFADGEQR